MPREWTEAERAILASVARRVPRGNQAKLTQEQVREIRRRTDSLTEPWTAQQLAAEYGVTPSHILTIARRKKWADPANEPDGEWWKEKELRERRAEAARNRR